MDQHKSESDLQFQDSIKDDGKDDKTASNVIINYLPLTMGETELRPLFERFGTISATKVVRDKYTQASLGYGFIRFETPESAIAAVTAMNGYPLDNKKLKVAIARPQSKEITRANLYISGFPNEWTEQELAELMSPYGKVIECRVLPAERKIQIPRSTLDDPTSKCRGVGFTRFDTHDNAQAAITALHGNIPPGGNSKLTVKFAEAPNNMRRDNGMGYGPIGTNRFPLQQRSPYGSFGGGGGYQNYGRKMLGSPSNNNKPQSSYPGVCLFIYHLTPDCNEHTLQQLFSNYGTVLSAKVMKDLHTGRNKGFGFVNMMNDQQAQLAISSLNGYQMGLNYLKVSYKK